MWEHLCAKCVSNIFVARTVFCMNAIHIFPQSLLVIISFIGGVIGVVSMCCINIWGWAFSLLCGCQRQGLLPSCWRMSRKSQIWSGSIVLEWAICPKGSDCWSKWNPYSHNEPMEDLYSWQFSKAVQITSVPLVFIPDDKAVVWSRLELGTKALWRQEPRWLCWRCGPVSLALPGPVCPRSGAKL